MSARVSNVGRAKAMALAAAVALSFAAQPGPANAQFATGQPYLAPGIGESLLTEPADKARYNALAEELRCLVCQNQTLADSDASLAVDLRRQLESMVVEGRSDNEIKSYLVDRYGEFVLYRPPVQSNTWLLWFGPFVLLAAGIGVWLTMQRRREAAAASSTPAEAGARSRSVDRPEAPSSGPGPDDIERARRLLDGG